MSKLKKFCNLSTAEASANISRRDLHPRARVWRGRGNSYFGVLTNHWCFGMGWVSVLNKHCLAIWGLSGFVVGVLNARSRSGRLRPDLELVPETWVLPARLGCSVILLISYLDVLPIDLWLHLIENWLLGLDWNRLLLWLLDTVVVDIYAQIFTLAVGVDHQLNGWNLLLRILDLALHNVLRLAATRANFLVLY